MTYEVLDIVLLNLEKYELGYVNTFLYRENKVNLAIIIH